MKKKELWKLRDGRMVHLHAGSAYIWVGQSYAVLNACVSEVRRHMVLSVSVLGRYLRLQCVNMDISFQHCGSIQSDEIRLANRS